MKMYDVEYWVIHNGGDTSLPLEMDVPADSPQEAIEKAVANVTNPEMRGNFYDNGDFSAYTLEGDKGYVRYDYSFRGGVLAPR